MTETKNNFPSRGGTVILINKPLGWTSFDVVKKIRNIVTPPRNPFKSEDGQSVRFKVGHAGTLDPLATGLLIICTDKMTRKISEFQELEKEYTGTFVLGATTPSYDLETDVTKGGDFSKVTEKKLRDTAKHFTGKIMQAAPLHSAKKIEGVRAYEIARKGGEAEMKPVTVLIHSFEITGIDLPNVSFKVVCSKGTYIRSLANDFGKELGCGAYLSSLCRTRIGDHKLENALTPEEFEKETLLAADAQIEK
jgi:tRNA pseudouridine55 synthase